MKRTGPNKPTLIKRQTQPIRRYTADETQTQQDAAMGLAIAVCVAMSILVIVVCLIALN